MSSDEQELANRLAEELTKIRVEDLLVQTVVTVSAVGFRRLGLTPDTKDDRDLAQARLAIETMKTLTPLLEQALPAELVRDFNASVANLQLAYAKAAAEMAADPATPPPSESPTADPATPESGDPSTPPPSAGDPTDAG